MSDSGEEKKPEGSGEHELSLMGHLDELRTRFIVCIVSLLAGTIICWFFSAPVLKILILPMENLVAAQGAESAEVEDEAPPLALVVAADGAVRFNYPERLGELESIDDLVLMIAVPGDEPTTRTMAMGGGGPKSKLIYSRPIDPFMMRLKVAVVMGILASLIIWVWQVWLFIAPGLTDKEKRVVRPLLMGAIVLFPTGALFAYAMVHLIVRVMQNYAVAGIEVLYTIQDYLKLMTNLMIVFGFIFELPLVVALMARVGIVTPEFLKHYRRHIYVVLAVVSMLITPADPFSMLMALIPLVALFELSIFIAKPMARIYRRSQDEDEAEGATP